MDRQEARRLASDAAVWYFTNNLGKESSNLEISKESSYKPKMSDNIWAQLMTEAILSFYDGLDLEPENKRANKDKVLFNEAVGLVGADAFRDMAFIVSAAGVRRPIEEEVEESFQTLQQAPGGVGTAFEGAAGLSGLITTDADTQTYGQASTIIMQVESSAPSQPLYHESSKKLTDLSATQGLSPPFSRALASLGAEYLRFADELTQQQASETPIGIAPSGVGVSGLPTGVAIAHRQRLIAIRKRIVKEARELA